MTRTSKYLNQATIAALQSFQIEKIDCEITDYLDTNNKMNSYHFVYCPKCFVVKNAENVLLWSAVSLLFILTKTNPNGMNLSWIH